jgi:hypothetical protein
MKKFLINNWYRLAISTSLMIASFGFLLYSAKSSFARPTTMAIGDTYIVANNDGIFAVKQTSLILSSSSFSVIKIR